MHSHRRLQERPRLHGCNLRCFRDELARRRHAAELRRRQRRRWQHRSGRFDRNCGEQSRRGGRELYASLGLPDWARVRAADLQELDLHGVRLSMGVCEFDPKNRALQLVEKADQAMFLAKRSGGNRIAWYSPETKGAVLVDRLP